MVRTISSNVTGKITKLFEATFTDFDFAKFGIKRESSGISDHWGRHGAEIYFTHGRAYEQWMFFGIYYDAIDHMIPFKQPQTPELAFFLDINPNKRETLKSVRGVESDILVLRHQGFDENLYNRLTSNKWRLLAKRVPLTEVKELNMETVTKFAASTLQGLKKRSTIWREMF